MSPLRFFSGFEAPVATNDEEEIFAEDSHRNDGDVFYDIIGAIEDIVVGDKFQELQTSILEKYHHHFENSEENKLIYTEIHKVYTTEIETFIETELSQRFSDFSMDNFLHQLSDNRDALEGDIFELLYSLSDFLVFKELFVDYSIMKKNHQDLDLSDLLSVSSYKN